MNEPEQHAKLRYKAFVETKDSIYKNVILAAQKSHENGINDILSFVKMSICESKNSNICWEIPVALVQSTLVSNDSVKVLETINERISEYNPIFLKSKNLSTIQKAAIEIVNKVNPKGEKICDEDLNSILHLFDAKKMLLVFPDFDNVNVSVFCQLLMVIPREIPLILLLFTFNGTDFFNRSLPTQLLAAFSFHFYSLDSGPRMLDEFVKLTFVDSRLIPLDSETFDWITSRFNQRIPSLIVLRESLVYIALEYYSFFILSPLFHESTRQKSLNYFKKDLCDFARSLPSIFGEYKSKFPLFPEQVIPFLKDDVLFQKKLNQDMKNIEDSIIKRNIIIKIFFEWQSLISTQIVSLADLYSLSLKENLFTSPKLRQLLVHLKYIFY